MLRVLPIAFLTACVSIEQPHERIVTLVISDNIKRDCGDSAVLESHGCAYLHGSECRIVAQRPKGFDDSERLKTLGHELWHCFVGPAHI